ncbi:MAG: hypothetical protein AB7L76_00680 [Burkholderiaceae bacterium]
MIRFIGRAERRDGEFGLEPGSTIVGTLTCAAQLAPCCSIQLAHGLASHRVPGLHSGRVYGGDGFLLTQSGTGAAANGYVTAGLDRSTYYFEGNGRVAGTGFVVPAGRVPAMPHALSLQLASDAGAALDAEVALDAEAASDTGERSHSLNLEAFTHRLVSFAYSVTGVADTNLWVQTFGLTSVQVVRPAR